MVRPFCYYTKVLVTQRAAYYDIDTVIKYLFNMTILKRLKGVTLDTNTVTKIEVYSNRKESRPEYPDIFSIHECRTKQGLFFSSSSSYHGPTTFLSNRLSHYVSPQRPGSPPPTGPFRPEIQPGSQCSHSAFQTLPPTTNESLAEPLQHLIQP